MMRCLFACFAALVAVPAYAQEDEPSVDPKKDDKAAVQAAFEASAKAGGFTFQGQLENDNGLFGQMKISGLNMGGGDLNGKLAGTVGADRTMMLNVAGGGSTYEVFRKGDRVVQRQTWTGRQEMVGAVPGEITTVLDLERLAKHAGKAREVSKGADRTVGGVDCEVYKGKLPTTLVPEEESEMSEELPVKMTIHELRAVEFTIHVGKDDRRIRKLEITLIKGFGGLFRMAGMGDDEEEGGEEDEDEDDPNPGMRAMKQMRFTNTYTITVAKYGAEIKPEFPPDVLKQFKE